jgi:hypothetical protein
MAVQVNFLLDKGAVQVRPDGTFAVDFTKVKDAVRDLAHDLLMIEANGDYDGAKKLLGTAVIRPEYRKALDRLSAVPVDIHPIFVTADELVKQSSAPPKKKAK